MFKKEELKRELGFVRVLEAKNYDTLSFSYSGVGRWQLRHMDDNTYEVWLNGELQFAWHEIDIESLCDGLNLIIDNDEFLYEKKRRFWEGR